MTQDGTQGRTRPSINVEVAEPQARRRRKWTRCELDEDVQFSSFDLESYFFSTWEPVVYDAMLVAAAVEFCDRTRRRPASGWARQIELRVPVHEPSRWQQPAVSTALHDALTFLTGDEWRIEFYQRAQELGAPKQGLFNLERPAVAVMPFSNGLDSRAVAGLMQRELDGSIVRVRVGSRGTDGQSLIRGRTPFAAVPYKVHSPARTGEPSARSRGFKFSLISGLAGYLAKAQRVIMPESGQGALGPVLVAVGQAYPDYRSHPRFVRKMERFLAALLGHELRFEFPQLWKTKAETLSSFVNECEEGAASWAGTRSCWQQNRHVSVDHKTRQCGVCAACMLRRVSVHAAGFVEAADTYVWEDLGAQTFNEGAASGFEEKKITRAMREYAIAGTLHLDHLATLRHSAANQPALDLAAFELGRACDMPQADARERLSRLLEQHEKEWSEFMSSLGPASFVAAWAAGGNHHA